jgi:preprotein translocase subunit YajC
MIVLLLLVVLMIFMMFRNRKKAQTQQEEKKNKLLPGAKVMTTAGIFGTVDSVDLDENKVVLEVSPGQKVTFHAQAISTFVDDQVQAASSVDTPADAAAAEDKKNEGKPEDTDGNDGQSNS